MFEAKPIIVMHRANNKRLIKRALSIKVPYIEVDVDRDKSSKLILNHGPDYKFPQNIPNKIRAFLINVIINRDPIFNALTLQEFMKLYSSEIGIWLDIKTKISEELIKTLSKYKTAKPLIISTGYYDEIRRYKRSLSNAIIFLGNVDYHPPTPISLVNMIRDSEADGISINHNYITRELVDYLHMNNYYVAAWTVNDSRRAIELIKLNVDIIITDIPEIILRIIHGVN